MTARRNTGLGTFLRTRRARLDPDGVGLAVGERRRVPGLRREEIARLAGVSPDYYTRLEQGRQPTASPSVLDALARTLQLSAEERLHLYALAGEGVPVPAAPSAPARTADDRVRLVLEALGDTPAIVYGPFVDIITANRAARFLFADFDALPPLERNAVGWMLLSPVARDLYRDQWDVGARDLIGMLRIDVGRRPGDPRGEQVVGQLNDASPYFRRVWTEYQVSTWQTEEKVLYHSAAGPLRFHNSAISVKGAPDQEISLIIPEDPQAFRAALAVWDQDPKAACATSGSAHAASSSAPESSRQAARPSSAEGSSSPACIAPLQEPTPSSPCDASLPAASGKPPGATVTTRQELPDQPASKLSVSHLQI